MFFKIAVRQVPGCLPTDCRSDSNYVYW